MGSLAALGGSLLVRSYERSDRVYRAMRLRGYGQATAPVDDEFQARATDLVLLALCLLLAGAFVAAELILRRGGI